MATVERPVEHPRALDATTMCEAFQITASERPDQVALRTPGDGMSITWAEYAGHVERLAGGLSALGVGRGDTVGLMLLNRPEFNLVDTAALHLGATPFSAYNTSSPDQLRYLFENAGNRVVVTQKAFAPAVRAAGVEHVIVIDEDDGLDALEAATPSGFHFDEAWRAVEPGDILTLIYTSGTTGPPKGVQITHANMLAENRGCWAVIPARPGGRMTSFLPSAHIADRWSAHYYASMTIGATLTSVADPRTIVSHLPEVRPTAWGAVPRIWEKIRAALEAQGIRDPSALPDEVKAGIRAKLGLDQVEWLIVGAAPTPPEVLEFFRDLGLEICELWGMSETSCCATINPPGRVKIGTCGPALPGVELRLAEDGELLSRGDLIMAGYRNDPEKTAEAIDDEGWLHTGDVATIDDDGYMSIVDRKKELIINAAGKNMSPANIEARLKASHPLIGQAVAIGDRRPYNVALIVLDPDACAALAAQRGMPDSSAAAMAADPGVQQAVAEGVAEANAHLSRVEQIKRFRVLPVDWEPGGEELTPTMKLKRKPIAEKYGDVIESMYANPYDDPRD